MVVQDLIHTIIVNFKRLLYGRVGTFKNTLNTLAHSLHMICEQKNPELKSFNNL